VAPNTIHEHAHRERDDPEANPEPWGLLQHSRRQRRRIDALLERRGESAHVRFAAPAACEAEPLRRCTLAANAAHAGAADADRDSARVLGAFHPLRIGAAQRGLK
jgi:hypothetical protein